MREQLPLVVQLAGLALLALGVGLVEPAAGIAIGGAGLIVFGVAAETQLVEHPSGESES